MAIEIDDELEPWERPGLTDEERAKIKLGLELVAEWEAEHGGFTAEELAEADRFMERVRANDRWWARVRGEA